MDPLFDSLVILGAVSMLYGVLGVLAGLAEKGRPVVDWLRRCLG